VSAVYLVYTSIDARGALAVVDACNEAVAAWLEEHEVEDDQIAELGPGGPIPSQPEVVAAHRRYRLNVSDLVIERLAECRASIAIDHPAPLGLSPLTASIMRFVLARTGPSLVLLNDYPILLSEEVLRGLRRRGAAGFDVEPKEPKRRPAKVTPRRPRAGEVRAIRVYQALSGAVEDPDLGLDVRAALARASDLARRYGALLLEGGPIDDARAAKALGVEVHQLETAAAALDASLSPLINR
jgi:hypothetical protein